MNSSIMDEMDNIFNDLSDKLDKIIARLLQQQFPTSSPHFDHISHVASASAFESSCRVGEKITLAVNGQSLTINSTSIKDHQPVLSSTIDDVLILKDSEDSDLGEQEQFACPLFKFHSVGIAVELFEEMPKKDLMSWNAKFCSEFEHLEKGNQVQQPNFSHIFSPYNQGIRMTKENLLPSLGAIATLIFVEMMQIRDNLHITGTFCKNVLKAGQIYAKRVELIDLALVSGKTFDGGGFKFNKDCFYTVGCVLEGSNVALTKTCDNAFWAWAAFDVVLYHGSNYEVTLEKLQAHGIAIITSVNPFTIQARYPTIGRTSIIDEVTQRQNKIIELFKLSKFYDPYMELLPMMAQKAKPSSDFTCGIEGLFKKNKETLLDTIYVGHVVVQGEHIIMTFGLDVKLLLAIIINENKITFTSQFWQTLFNNMGTTLAISSAYQSESDGQILNKCIEYYMRCFTAENPKYWAELLSSAEFSYSPSFHTSIGMPFQAVYGREPPSLLPYHSDLTDHHSVTELFQQRDQVLLKLRANLYMAQQRIKRFADGKCTEMQFEVVGWVLVKLQLYQQKSVFHRRNRKLNKCYFGPFQIIQKLGAVAYKLCRPEHATIQPEFHISLLKKYIHAATTIDSLLPATSKEWRPLTQPMEIISTRVILCKEKPVRQCLILWEGLRTSEATWQDVQHLRHQSPQHFIDLEDKVGFEGRSNVMGLNRVGLDHVKEPVKERMEVNIESGKKTNASENKGSIRRWTAGINGEENHEELVAIEGDREKNKAIKNDAIGWRERSINDKMGEGRAALVGDKYEEMSGLVMGDKWMAMIDAIG